MRKLTDEELSRVLSQQAVGLLVHDTFGQSSMSALLPECGCVAGAAFEMGGIMTVELEPEERLIAWGISRAAEPKRTATGFKPYPKTPEALLVYLAERGLA